MTLSPPLFFAFSCPQKQYTFTIESHRRSSAGFVLPFLALPRMIAVVFSNINIIIVDTHVLYIKKCCTTTVTTELTVQFDLSHYHFFHCLLASNSYKCCYFGIFYSWHEIFCIRRRNINGTLLPLPSLPLSSSSDFSRLRDNIFRISFFSSDSGGLINFLCSCMRSGPS